MDITLPYDPEWRALQWAKEYCPSYITNKASVGGHIVYYFFNAEDAMMFKLKWV